MKQKQHLSLLILLISFPLIFTSCRNEPDTQNIVNKSIATHGGDLYNRVDMSFDFRDRHYKIRQQGGKFKYESLYQDSTGADIHNILNNKGFFRKRNGSEVDLSAEDSVNYASSLNSVVYFALLPHGLNDPAVIKEYLGESKIKGQPYHKIRVTFQKKGGGKDYEDEFIYWFHQEKYTMDYLAYRYHTEGGGTRFRDAFNVRQIKGITFADHHNYKYKTKDHNIAHYDSLFEKGVLEKVSEIKLENIQVNILPQP